MLIIFRQKFNINEFTQIDNRKSYMIGDSKGIKSPLSELFNFTDCGIKKVEMSILTKYSVNDKVNSTFF